MDTWIRRSSGKGVGRVGGRRRSSSSGEAAEERGEGVDLAGGLGMSCGSLHAWSRVDCGVDGSGERSHVPAGVMPSGVDDGGVEGGGLGMPIWSNAPPPKGKGAPLSQRWTGNSSCSTIGVDWVIAPAAISSEPSVGSVVSIETSAFKKCAVENLGGVLQTRGNGVGVGVLASVLKMQGR